MRIKSKEDQKLENNAENQIGLGYDYKLLKLSWMQKKRKSICINNPEEIILYVYEAQEVVSKWKLKKEY